MKESPVTFPSGNLTLEGVLSLPEREGPFPVVVLCHPHPLYGGSMDNNILYAISQALCQGSIAALRFNFRGVGMSQGHFGRGVGEEDDVKAALTYAASLEIADPARMALAGYSFGAAVAIPIAASDDRVKALAAVSPPVPSFDPLMECYKPKFLVCGGRDTVVPLDTLLRFAEELPSPKKWEVIADADHFWWGYEEEVAAKVVDFLQDVLRSL